jgi:CHAD domain-containing protein
MESLLGKKRSNTRHARKIVRKEIRRAARKLDGALTDDEGIHDARRHIKRARATLRLMRPALSASAYRAEDQLLSQAARPLGRVRDGKILIENLDELLPSYRGARPILGTQTLRRALAVSLANERDQVLTGGKGLRSTHRLLAKARRRANRWPTQRRDAAELLRGLRKDYGKGRRFLEASRADSSADNLHALRKQAKYLAHQLRLFAPAKTSRLGRLAESFHQLSDDLGDDHDLAILHQQVSSLPEIFPEPQSQTRLVTLIEQRRTALQKKALLRAEGLYRDKSGRFAREVRSACRAANGTKR